MSTFNLFSYDSVNHHHNKTAKVTPKSFKVFHEEDSECPWNSSKVFTLHKPHGIYNRLINITFPSGKVRQMVMLTENKENGMMTSDEVVQQSVLAHLHNENDRFIMRRSVKIVGDQYDRYYDGKPYLIQHKDDKVYDVFRWVITRKGSRERGIGARVIYDLMTPLNKETDNICLIKEQWIRWGDKDICCDTGLKERTLYHYDDPYEGLYPKWSRKLTDYSSKNVSEFPTNPFGEGEHIVPRHPHTLPTGEKVYVKEEVACDVAVKSFLWKREIAEAVFHPARVEKMLEQYGQEWIDEIV